jgi:hypothetical protein
MHGTDEKYSQFSLENLKGTWKCVLEKLYGREWIGFIWFRTGVKGGLL